MSKIHVLESNNNWGYRVAIHFAVPAGTNTSGYNWKQCALNSQMIGQTSLEVGTGPSNITQVEYDSIIAGDIIEIIETINPGLTPTTAVVEELCDVLIAKWYEDAAKILKYYGLKIE